MILVPTEPLSRKSDCAALRREDAIMKYREQFDDRRVGQAREAVLRRLAVISSLRDLESHIADEVVETPATYADRYNVAAGSPFALSHGLAQLSLMRPGPQSGKAKNQLFVGASSRPGNGVPLVLLGAKKAADLAIKILRS